MNNYLYKKASGRIKVPLTNDLLFHYVTQKSNKILKNLVCSLKGISPETINEVLVTNPINYAEYEKKMIILDVRVILNNSEILDIEIQMYHDEFWESRSLLYLCRAYDSLEKGEEYGKLKPTTMIAIVNEDLFPENPEFYSRFQMMHQEKHYPYSTKFGINVLYLNRIGLATKEDRKNNLDYWARLFKSETWEELQQLAEDNPIGEEVAEIMYEAVMQSEEKTVFEGHQRFLYEMNAARKDAEKARVTMDEAQKIRQEAEKMTREAEEMTREAEEMTREAEEMTREAEEMTREAKEMTREAREMVADAEKQIASKEEEISRLKKLLQDNGIQP